MTITSDGDDATHLFCQVFTMIDSVDDDRKYSLQCRLHACPMDDPHETMTTATTRLSHTLVLLFC